MLSRARDAGVDSWVVAGTDPEGWRRVEQVAAESGGHAALGLHPWWAARLTPPAITEALELLWSREPPILGEIGLDRLHGRTEAAWAAQMMAFRAQLDAARTTGRPAILHVVRAAHDILEIVTRDGLPRSGAIWHGWTGSPELAERATTLGIHLSIGPQLLSASGHKVRATAATLTLDWLVLESDSPHAALPEGPAGLTRIAEAIDKARRLLPGTTLSKCSENARRVLLSS